METDPELTQVLESAERFKSNFYNCILYFQNVRHEDIKKIQIELLRVKKDNVWDGKCTEWEAQRLDKAEEKITELEGIATKTIQNETQRKKNQKKKEHQWAVG